MSEKIRDVALDTIDAPADAPEVGSSHELMLATARAAAERKGSKIVALHVAEVSFIADYFTIVTGFSRVQVRAIAQAIEAEVEEKLGRQPLRKEGLSEGTWALLDYGEAIVHVLLPEEREFYNLEAFWGHAEQVELPEELFE
ncbi:MAG: ribosome silencing factor [Geitlerinemataceae cyanobacterium]